MKKITCSVVVGVLALAAAGEAQAISRYNSLSMTCAGAREKVEQEGAVILRYPSKRVRGMTLYDRVVRSSSECGNYEFADTKTLPTSDNPQCRVRACVPKTDDDWWLRP